MSGEFKIDIHVFHHFPKDGPSSLEQRILALEKKMGKLADDFNAQVADVATSLANAATRVQTDLAAQNQKIADLEDQVANNPSMTADEKAALQAAIDGLKTTADQIDPTTESVLP